MCFQPETQQSFVELFVPSQAVNPLHPGPGDGVMGRCQPWDEAGQGGSTGSEPSASNAMGKPLPDTEPCSHQPDGTADLFINT